MPRNMSFMLTTAQVRAGTKTITRRLGWYFLKPGDIVNAVEKCRGLKKGEKVKFIRLIQIVHTEQQRLHWIDAIDVILEGFPGMPVYDFVAMFMKANRCRFDREVNRIEFEYI